MTDEQKITSKRDKTMTDALLNAPSDLSGKSSGITQHSDEDDQTRHDQQPNRGNDLKDKLDDLGLDPTYWLKQFEEKLGVTQSVQLLYLTTKDINILSKLVRRKWEIEALKKIAGEKENKEITDCNKQIVEKIETELKCVDSDTNNIEKLRSAINRENKDIPATKRSFEITEVLSSFTSSNACRPTVSKHELDTIGIINQASGGLALIGINYTTGIALLNEKKRKVIEVFGHITMDAPLMTQLEEFVDFTDKNKRDEFYKTLNTNTNQKKLSLNLLINRVGLNTHVSKSNIDDSETKRIKNSEDVYHSRSKFAFVPLKSCELKVENIKLVQEVVAKLKQIEDETKTCHDCSALLSLCSEFFKSYGSHVRIGKLHFGGIYKWEATYRSKNKTENVFITNIVQDALDGLISIGIAGLGVGAGISGKCLKNKSTNVEKYEESELSKISLKIEPIGGPSDEMDFQSWKYGLVNTNATWSLINSDDLIGIWDVLQNHKSDFNDYEILSRILECAWNMEDFKNSVNSIDLNYMDLLQILCTTIERLQEITNNTNRYIEELVRANDGIQRFLEYIADSEELQEEINNKEMKHCLSIVLKPLRNIFLPSRINLVKWIEKENENTEDMPMKLQLETINDVDGFIACIANTFLSQVRSAETMHRQKHQQSIEHFITIEFTKTCQQLLKQFESQPRKEQFAIFFSLLQKFQYEDKKGFPRLLSRSDIEEFVEDTKVLLNDYNKAKGESDFQNQALLVDFIVANTLRYSSLPSGKAFQKCYLELKDCLDDNIKQIIETQFQDECDWELLRLDLKPLKDGKETKVHIFSIQMDTISITNQKLDYVSQAHRYPDELVTLLVKLKMSQYLSHTLNVKDVISIQSRSSEPQLESLPWVFLNAILTQNSSVYDVIGKHLIQHTNLSLNQTENGDEDTHEEETIDYGFLNFAKDEPTEALIVNPLDLIVSIFACCSQHLRQILSAKLQSCRLAIPVLFPWEPNHFLLGHLRSIMISTSRSLPVTAVDYPCNVLSFVRIGRPNFSKSRFINEFLSKPSHDTFFNQDLLLGGSQRKICNGLVEIAFLFASCNQVKHSQHQNMTMILNLRGDISKFDKQRELLSSISSAIIVLTTAEELEKTENVELVQTLCTPNKVVVILLHAFCKSKEDLTRITRPYISSKTSRIHFVILAMQGHERKKIDIQNDLLKKVEEILLKLPTKSILQILNESTCHFIYDENFKTTDRQNLETLATHISSDSVWPLNDLVPLQLEPLYKLSRNEKMMYKPSEYKTQENKLNMRTEKSKYRRKQLELMENLHPFMVFCLKSLVYNAESADECFIFTDWIKYFTANLSRKSKSLNMKTEQDFAQFECLTEISFENNILLSTTPFEFEHLMREMGQLYEAATEQKSIVSPKTLDFASKFPLVQAKLLLMGLPFELMNGDYIHVPIMWVKAVLNHVVGQIGDKKCFILSIIGIQSSGKSTLLNTMFGLQFPVGYGRVTKGAFMQLIPVKHDTLPFDYILVIDTEGLRAPEWGDDNYFHDTQFATFVIGLADINIINIKGENAAEMNDVLQMVVYSLLRLKLANDKLNQKQTCMFVHHNVDSSIEDTSRSILQQFLDSLDKKTAAAAEEMEMSDVHSFNDVICIKPEYVWYFPDLLSGAPPMSHTSTCYSLKATVLKKAILDIAASNKSCFNITATGLRIENIWNGILMEDFCFDFRNTLEVKAFKAIERQYHKLQWDLERSIFDFIQKETLTLKKLTDRSQQEQIIDKTIDSIPDFIHKQIADTKKQFESFIDENTLKKVMIKWKQSYILKMESFGKSVGENSKIKMQSAVEEIEQTRKCDRIIQECQENVNVLACKLAEDIKSRKCDQNAIEEKFNNEWLKWVAEVSARIKYKTGSVSSRIKQLVRDRNSSNNIYLNELEHLTDEECRLVASLCGTIRHTDIKNKKHIRISSSKSLIAGCMQAEKASVCIDQAIDFTDKLFSKIEHIIYEYSYLDTRFEDLYFNNILMVVEDAIKRHNERKDDQDQKFTFLPTYNAIVLTWVTKYCINKFLLLNDKYDQKHSPRAKLENYKDTAKRLFFHIVDSNSENEIAADFFHEIIKESVLEYLNNVLPGEVENLMLDKFNHAKYEILKSVMTDLVKTDEFSYFKMYISDAEIYVEQWLMNKTNEVLFAKHGDKPRVYDSLCKKHIDSVFDDVQKAVNSASVAVKGKFGNIISQWILSLISYTRVLPLSEERLSHVLNRNVTDVPSFQRTILIRLEETKKSVFAAIFSTDVSNITWTRIPYLIIFERLWGCPECCPFCNEPCEYTNKDHLNSSVRHSCKQHRPQGIGGFAWNDGNGPLLTEVCNYLIQTDNVYYLDKTKCKYRHFKSKFPEWDIPPSNDSSKYWMWFLNKYKTDIAKMNNSAEPKISIEWTKIGVKEALESL